MSTEKGMTIIPAIDLIGGHCVRLTQGDYESRREYSCDPLDMALRYQDCGVSRLHIVDLDGAKAKEPANLAVLERLASRTSLDIEWGGGIKNGDALQMALNAGADRVICGSVAVDSPELFTSWIRTYKSSRIILGADVRNGKVATHGWLKDSTLSVDDLLKRYVEEGLNQMICTDISRDGMLQGPDFGFYVKLQNEWPAVDVTLSGGISSMADVEKADSLGVRAVIIGKAIYEGRITLKELGDFISGGR